MGIALPQLAPASEDRVSGTQVIDGSLKFDDTKKNYLTQTIGNGTGGFTISCWMKPCQTGNRDEIFDTGASTGFYLYRHTNGEIKINNNSANLFTSNGKYIDTTAFYNIVFSYDSTSGYGSLYVNGRLDKTTEFTTQLYAGTAKISSEASTDPANYYLGQWYLIDGLALGPGYFGFTDPLTGTWRPKKFKAEGTTANDGTRWRDYLTSSNGGWHADPYGLTAAFNGVVGSGSGGYCQAANGSANPNSVTFDVSSIGGIPFKNSVEVWLINNANTVTVNGGEAQSIAGTTFVTVARGPGVLNTIVFERPSTNGASLGTIRVDGVNLRDDLTQNLAFGTNGFYLPMDGNTPIGEDQAPSVNNGTVWSNTLTSSSGFRSSEPKTNAFDGDTSSICSAVGSGTITFTSPVTFASNSTIRVFLHGGDHTVTVNGGSDQTISAGSFQTVTYSNSGNATFTMTFHRGGGSDTGVRAIEIDGVVLTDGQIGNSWTPVNFGGSNSIEKATGAKPILSTINGGTIARPGVFGSDVSATYTTTSASNSGGQYYFSHDSSAKPTFSFIRGATYTFDYSASSSHPLRFATAADAAGSTEYTDGTSISGNVIKFTVPHNAPDTLYYYCNVHNGMGNSISVTTDETKADPYAWKCVLAMPLVGNSVDVSNELNCTSTTKDTADAGNAHSSSDKSVFYNGSYEFDGSGDWVTPTANADFAFGTGDFTAEAWFNADDIADYRTILDGRSTGASSATGWIIGQRNSKKIYVYSNGFILQSTSLPEIGSWNHVAFVRSGSTETLYINGVAEETRSSSSNYSDQNSRIGGEGYSGGGASFAWNGYISDVRLYKGVAKYTSNFIPAATNPDILPDSPSGVATKSKLTKITDGAVHFDGSSDALKVPDHADLRFGTGAFTIETFVYFNSFDDNYPSIISKYTGGTASWIMRVRNTGKAVYYDGGGNNNESSTNPIVLKKWHHIAMVREGTGSNQAKMYVDGKLAVTATDATDYTDTQEITIGAQNASDSNVLNGYMSNVRIIKGTALYTSDFIPPTEPLTNVTNTKLLCCHSTTQPGAAVTAPNMGGINDGTQWSAGAGPNFEAVNPATDGFNGDENSNTRTDNITATATVTLPKEVPFTTLKVRGARDSGNGTITLTGGNGGVDVSSQFTSSSASLETVTITGVTSPLKAISLTGIAGAAQPRFSAIYIDNVMLVDPATPIGDTAATTFNPFNTDINTVRGQESGYATLNPLDKLSNVTLSNGNLTCTSGSNVEGVRSTIPFPRTGMWYVEYHMDTVTTSGYPVIGIANASKSLSAYAGSGTASVRPVGSGRNLGWVIDSSDTPSGYMWTGFALAAGGDTMQIAFNADKGAFYMGVNNFWWGLSGSNAIRVSSTDMLNGTNSAYDVSGDDYFAWAVPYQGKCTLNYGQKPFKFPPPDGFQPLNASTARPETVITRPNQYVSATLYTGNGASSPGGSGGTQSIDVKHKPDLIWIKDRTQQHNHNLIDSVNGAPNLLMSDLTNTLDTTSTDGVTAITDTGFTLGDNGAGTQSLEMNKSGNNYVAWTWKAGGNAGTFNIDDVGYANASDVNMSAGTFNSSVYDQSQRWRDNITSSNGWNTSYPVNNAFNGSFDGGGGAANNGGGGTVTFTPPAAITVTKLELSCYNPVTLTLPDGTTQEIAGVSSADRYVEADIGSGFSFTGSNSITISRTGGFIYLERIKINGKELVDDDITPANVPSIPATACSVGTKQGFSIIKYAGSGSNSTFPHGLTQAPDFYIVKCLDVSNESWRVYHSSLGATKALTLNSGSEPSASNVYWNNTEPTSTVASVYAGYDGVNNTGRNYIAYCWHDVPGLQKFGSYVANGSADGPFVEVGFRPAVVWCKVIQTGQTDNWAIQDTARAQFNTYDSTIRLNDNAAEVVNSGNYHFDFTSNGFKIRNTNGEYNGGSGWQYIYCAWAEAPVSNLYGAQSNAF